MKPASLAQYLCPQIARLLVSQISRNGRRTAVGTLDSVSVLPIAELSPHRCYKRHGNDLERYSAVRTCLMLLRGPIHATNDF